MSKLINFILLILIVIMGIVIISITTNQNEITDETTVIETTVTSMPTDIPVTETVRPTEIPATETASPSATAVSTITPSPTLVPTQTAIPTPTRIPVDVSSIINKITSQFKIVSVESIITVETKYNDKDYLLITEGKYTVIAGVDVNKITTENATKTENGDITTVKITLPPTMFIGEPGLIQNSLKIPDKVAQSLPEQWKQFWYGKSLTIPQTQQIFEDHTKEAKRRACEAGLLKFAADHAQYQLRDFLMEVSPSDKIRYVVESSAGECSTVQQ